MAPKRGVKQPTTVLTRKRGCLKSVSSDKKEALVCPKCRAIFKGLKTFQRHTETQTRKCRKAERLLAGGKEDRYLEWKGNKYRVRELIASIVPAEVTEIVSPFWGSGAVEFQLLRSRPNLHMHASDLDKGLVTFWQELLRSPEDLVNQLRKLVPNRGLVQKQQFDQWKNALQGDSISYRTDTKVAACFWIVNKLTFNGFMDGKACSYQVPQAQKLHEFREKRFQHLLCFKSFDAHRLDLKVCNCFDAIAASSPDSLLFLDPPYLSTSQYSANIEGAFGNSLHGKLRELLGSRTKWILCHEDIPDIRDLYAGFDAIEYSQFSSINCGGKRKGSSEGLTATMRPELLIVSPWVVEHLKAEHGLKIVKLEPCGPMPMQTSAATPLQSSASTRFEDSCKEVHAWVLSHGGMLPKMGAADFEERRLAKFLNKVQCTFRSGSLGPSQIARVRQIPGMNDRFFRWVSKRCSIPSLE